MVAEQGLQNKSGRVWVTEQRWQQGWQRLKKRNRGLKKTKTGRLKKRKRGAWKMFTLRSPADDTLRMLLASCRTARLSQRFSSPFNKTKESVFYLKRPARPFSCAYFSIFRDLQDSRTFAPFQIQKFSKFSSICFLIFLIFCKNIAFFDQNHHFSHRFQWIFLGISRISSETVEISRYFNYSAE